LVAVADSGSGLFLSTDGGKHFARVKGVTHVTAMTLACTEAQKLIFAASYSLADDKSSIVEIDGAAPIARTIAALGDVEHEDSEDALHLVVQLKWSAAQGRLFAVGAFGAVSFDVSARAPSSRP
jgi:hypothetical protein